MFRPLIGKLRKFWLQELLFLVLIGLTFLWLGLTPSGFMGKLRAVAASVCEQDPTHTLNFDGNLLPLCARCTGMFLGAFVSLLFLALRGRATGRPSLWKCLVLGAFILTFAIDGVNSFLAEFVPAHALYGPNNILRFMTGMGMGTVIGVILWPIWNETIWSKREKIPVLQGWKMLPGLLVIETTIAGLVLTKNGRLFYPLAVLSTGTILVLITMIYTLLWIVGLKKENRVHFWKELILYIELGAICALIQIGTFDLIRFLLLGSWQGIQIQ